MSSELAVPPPVGKFLVQKLSDKAKLPTRGSALAAGYDLYSFVWLFQDIVHRLTRSNRAEKKTVPARGKAMISTDLAVAVPEGTYGRVAPRSGLGELAVKRFQLDVTRQIASKFSIDTGAGVVDADYRGTLHVLLFNYSDKDYEGQLCCHPSECLV